MIPAQKNKEKSSDRILVLKLQKDSVPLSSLGLMDKRLWTGGNRVHAVMNQTDCLWKIKYDAGSPPQPLRQRFVSFDSLMRTVKDYFNKRNLDIVEVID